MKYVITVEGIDAAPQGSKSYIGKNKLGRGMMIESCKRVKPFRNAVRGEAKKVVSEIIKEPVHIEVEFWFKRPKSHFDSKGKVLPSEPKYPTKMNIGDIDKLCRSTLDALTLSAIADDSQVVSLQARKYYCDNKKPGPKKPGAMITIQSIDDIKAKQNE